MAEETEIVDKVINLIRSMIPKFYAALPPEVMIVGNPDAGKGTAICKGNIVDTTTHPMQSLTSGDIVVGIPIGPSLYYIVGKK